AWERPFAVLGKETFGLKFVFELGKGQLQRAQALRLHRPHDELILPTRFVNRQIALQDELLPILEKLPVAHRRPAEQHAAQLSSAIFEREVKVAGGLGAQVGDFAGDPNLAQLLLEQPPDRRRQFADAQHPAGWLAGEQLTEFPLGFDFSAHGRGSETRWMLRVRPVCSSTSSSTPCSRTRFLATSKRCGRWVTNRRMTGSISRPRTLSCGPVKP